MQALFMPYDHKNTTPYGLPTHQMKLLLEEVNHLHCQKHCVIGSGGGSVGLVFPTVGNNGHHKDIPSVSEELMLIYS